MMKYEDITAIEDGLKAMLDDEEKGIAEYEKKIQEASGLGAFATAMELQIIKKQESEHADKLRILIGRMEFVKFGMKPGQEVNAVMEPVKTGVQQIPMPRQQIPMRPVAQRVRYYG